MNDLGEGEEAADLLAREKAEEKMRCFWREKKLFIIMILILHYLLLKN
jgi:hypothetical protein